MPMLISRGSAAAGAIPSPKRSRGVTVGSRRGLTEQFSHCRRDAKGDFGHSRVVECFGRVGGLVVVRITQEAGVGQH